MSKKPEKKYGPGGRYYRKRVPKPGGGYQDVYAETVEDLAEKVADLQLAWARAAAAEADPLVFEYAAKWFRLHTAGLGKKRIADYRNAINNHICPVIGERRLSALAYSDVREVMTAAASLSKSSQQKLVTTLRRICEAAVRDGLLQHDPTAGLKAAGKASEEKEALTRDQQARLLAAVAGLNTETFVRLCLYAGLRREEALGLMWRDLDLDEKKAVNTLTVNRVCAWDGGNAAEIRTELKSKAARRTIPIPAALADHLRQLQPGSSSPYVCPGASGEPMTAAAFRRMWAKIAQRTVREVKRKQPDGKTAVRLLQVGERASPNAPEISLDFHVTPHQLRHTYISELILAGANIRRVQYLAGHANPTVTLRIYTHLMENKTEDLAAEIAKAWG